MSGKRLALSLTSAQASAVEDALSYYETASQNNFDMGYAGDPEARRDHERVRRVLDRLSKIRAEEDA